MKSKYLIIFLGRIVQVVCSFLIIKYVTKVFSPEEVGRYFLFIAVINYFGLSLISPFGQFFNRMLNEWKIKGVLFNRTVNQLVYVLGVSFVSVPVSIILQRLGFIPEEIIDDFLILLPLMVFFMNMVSTIVPSFNLIGLPGWFVFYTNCWIVVGFIFSHLIIEERVGGPSGWFIGQIISLAIVGGVASVHFLKKCEVKFNREEWKRSFNFENIKSVKNFVFPLFFSTLLLWVTTESFRLVLEQTHGLAYVGMFSVGFAIANRFSYAVESIVHQLFLPNFYGEIVNPRERSKTWLKLFYSSLPFYVGVLIFTIVFSKQLLLIFSNENYADSFVFLISGAFFNFFRKMTSCFSLLAHSEMKTGLLIIPYFVSGFMSSVGLFVAVTFFNILPEIFIPLSGLAGFLFMVFKTKDMIRHPMKWEDFIDTSRNILRREV